MAHHIAIVVYSFPEVSETFIINKVLFLAKEGFHVDVINLGGAGNKQLVQLYQLDKISNIRIVQANLPKKPKDILQYATKNPIGLAKSFRTKKNAFYQQIKQQILSQIFTAKQYAIVHFEFSGIGTELIDFIPTLSAKKVVSCRGTAEKVKPLTEPNRKAQLKQLFAVIDAVHCVSEDMHQTILPYCQPTTKVFVNRPAIDASFFQPASQKSSNSIPHILTIGRMTFQKGYIIGLLAMKQLVNMGVQFKWHIIGDGPQMEELIFHVHTLQLENQVFLVGKKNKDEVNAMLQQADVFLLTSYYEGIPNVVLEAMAMELPVVSTTFGGIDEVITHGEDGMLAKLYDSEAVAAHVASLLQNPSLRVTMGQKARKRILDAFTLQRQVQVFKEAYTSLINEKNR